MEKLNKADGKMSSIPMFSKSKSYSRTLLSFNAERLKRKVSQTSTFQPVLFSSKNMPKTSCRRAYSCALCDAVHTRSILGKESLHFFALHRKFPVQFQLPNSAYSLKSYILQEVRIFFGRFCFCIGESHKQVSTSLKSCVCGTS